MQFNLQDYFNSEIVAFSISYDNDDESVKNKLKRTLDQVSEFINNKGIKCKTELVNISSSSNFSGSIINYTKNIKCRFNNDYDKGRG